MLLGCVRSILISIFKSDEFYCTGLLQLLSCCAHNLYWPFSLAEIAERPFFEHFNVIPVWTLRTLSSSTHTFCSTQMGNSHHWHDPATMSAWHQIHANSVEARHNWWIMGGPARCLISNPWSFPDLSTLWHVTECHARVAGKLFQPYPMESGALYWLISSMSFEWGACKDMGWIRSGEQGWNGIFRGRSKCLKGGHVHL